MDVCLNVPRFDPELGRTAADETSFGIRVNWTNFSPEKKKKISEEKIVPVRSQYDHDIEVESSDQKDRSLNLLLNTQNRSRRMPAQCLQRKIEAL